MRPVKINIFISHAPEDAAQLNKLLRWLYPMRDEVNLWYNSPPPPPPELSLPWQLLLFWYIAPDNRGKYYKIIKTRRRHAHIYLFLTSFKSLSNRTIEEDIDVAATRRIAGDDFVGPFIFPIILSPSRWKEESRLAGFTPMAGGKPLSAFIPEEEGYLEVTEEVSALLKVLQGRLGEEKFYQSRLAIPEKQQLSAGNKNLPYLGESDDQFEFYEIAPFQPPEWLGWSILLFIFISILGGLMPANIPLASRYETEKKPLEYLRQHPMVQPTDSISLPAPD